MGAALVTGRRRGLSRFCRSCLNRIEHCVSDLEENESIMNWNPTKATLLSVSLAQGRVQCGFPHTARRRKAAWGPLAPVLPLKVQLQSSGRQWATHRAQTHRQLVRPRLQGLRRPLGHPSPLHSWAPGGGPRAEHAVVPGAS